tara:strand:- start:269 stop:496 length:228 start_codon:yes stop_codon:yes gene_type:complete
MANVELRFLDFYDKELVYLTTEVASIRTPIEDDFNDRINISIHNSIGDEIEIYLDKSTAIRFAKTIRTEINKIKD